MNVWTTKDETPFIDKLPVTATVSYLKATTNCDYGWFVSERYVLPYIIEKRAFFRRLVVTHESIPLIDENEMICEEKEFLNDVVECAKKMHIDFIYQPRPGVVFRTYPNNAKYAQFGSYQVNLQKTENDLFLGLHSKHRNVIRKAQKDGVIILAGDEYLDICSTIIENTMRRQKLPYINKGEIVKMKGTLKEELVFYVAYFDDIPQGAAMFVYNVGFSCYYLHGGSISNCQLGAMNLLHWTAMNDMKSIGVHFYDFVGARLSPPKKSKLEGIQRFKSRFGGELRQGYLWKIPLNNFKYNLFYIIARFNFLIRGMKYKGDIIDEESKRSYSDV